MDPRIAERDGSSQEYPHQLEQRFAHVIRRLGALWGAEQAHAFLDSLVPAAFPIGQEFPLEVQAEIDRLRAAYLARYPDQQPSQRAPGPPVAESPAPAPPPVEPEPDHDVWKGERPSRR